MDSSTSADEYCNKTDENTIATITIIRYDANIVSK